MKVLVGGKVWILCIFFAPILSIPILFELLVLPIPFFFHLQPPLYASILHRNFLRFTPRSPPDSDPEGPAREESPSPKSILRIRTPGPVLDATVAK